MRPINIDILTIMLVLALINIVSALFLAAAMRLLPGGGGRLSLFLLTKSFQGLSWAIRLLVFLGGPAWLAPGANLFLLLGFALEAALFVSFKGPVAGGWRLFFGASLALSAAAVLLLAGTGLDNLVVLAVYLGSMGFVSCRLLFREPRTRYMKLLGLLYGAFPLASAILHLFLLKEVTTPGIPTSGAGLAYYVSVLSMQMIGSVGYLLMVKERDEDNLAEAASSDALTGILNRRAFFDRADMLMANAIRSKDPVTVAIMDLDRFKVINDTHGHQAGDRAIMDFCATVQRSIRKGDLFARHGGDEFVLFLPRATREEAETVVARIRADLAAGNPAGEPGLPRITASIGLSTGIPRDARDIDRLLAASDLSLYRAKAAGRDRAYWLALGAEGPTAERIGGGAERIGGSKA